VIINWIAKIIVAINTNRRPGEIAAGAAFGLMLALIPAGNLLWVVLFAMTFFLRINLAIELVLLGVFKLLVPLLDGPVHSLGYTVLTIPALQGLFTLLYNAPLVAFTRFNNTIVMGGFLLGALLWLPVFLLFRLLVNLYRGKLRERIANSRIVKGFLKLPIVSTLARAIGKLSAMYSGAG